MGCHRDECRHHALQGRLSGWAAELAPANLSESPSTRAAPSSPLARFPVPHPRHLRRRPLAPPPPPDRPRCSTARAPRRPRRRLGRRALRSGEPAAPPPTPTASPPAWMEDPMLLVAGDCDERTRDPAPRPRSRARGPAYGREPPRGQTLPKPLEAAYGSDAQRLVGSPWTCTRPPMPPAVQRGRRRRPGNTCDRRSRPRLSRAPAPGPGLERDPAAASMPLVTHAGNAFGDAPVPEERS